MFQKSFAEIKPPDAAALVEADEVWTSLL